MTDYVGFSGKLRAYDDDSEMPATLMTLMACMQGAVILNLKAFRGKY